MAEFKSQIILFCNIKGINKKFCDKKTQEFLR